MPYESELEAGIGQPRSSLRKLGDWGLSLYTCGKIMGWCHFGIKGESKGESRKNRGKGIRRGKQGEIREAKKQGSKGAKKSGRRDA